MEKGFITFTALVLSSAAVITASNLAFAGDKDASVTSDQLQQSKSRFEHLDSDKNGYLSLHETKDQHRVFYYFPKADKNSDGHLEYSEFSAFEVQVPAFE